MPKLKAPATTITQAFAFAAPLASVAAVDIAAAGLVLGGAPLSVEGVPTLSGNTVSLVLRGGAEGETYDVQIRVAYAGGGEAASDVQIVVLRDAWTMDDGAPGMVGLHGLIDRFGFAEMVNATSDGRGSIDVDWLIGAMRDAQSLVAAELSRSYDLPLPSLPGIIATALCDLAIERLHRRAAPDTVALNAKVARAQLERVGKGVLSLPGISGRVAQTQASDGGAAVLHDDLGGVAGFDRYASGDVFRRDDC